LSKHTSADTRGIAMMGRAFYLVLRSYGLGILESLDAVWNWSPRFHSHLVGCCRGRVHIGVLSIRLVLQSFCRPRRPGKKHAVTVNTVSFDKFLLARSRLARLLTWAMLKTAQDIIVW